MDCRAEWSTPVIRDHDGASPDGFIWQKGAKGCKRVHIIGWLPKPLVGGFAYDELVLYGIMASWHYENISVL